MTEHTDKKRIAKNTVFLYFRMLFVMGVSLYTSRVILEVLGIDDFGIYQAVGGVVGMLTFVNSSLSTGTSRFITFELGKGDAESLKNVFSTTLAMQLILIGLVILVAETLGTWFVINKMKIPEGTETAAIWTYHISILTTAISLVSVPFLAVIIAHEKLNVFAYLGIYEVCAKLGIVYLLTIGGFDKLIFYALLLMTIQLTLTSFYVIYCVRRFPECRCSLVIKRKIFREIVGFSGWSLFASSSIALNNQGILVLINMFFSPSVVTARTISLQVNSAANQFVSNFRTAVNPQIVKQYAAHNFEESKSLLLSSTKYSYYMMFLLSLPICLGAKPLLEIWLKEVPEYAVIFLQLVVIQSLFQVFDTSFYTALYAKGDLKLNALISPTLGFLMFPVVYFLFKAGYSPVALSWSSLIVYALLGLVVKPILIIKIANYRWNEILEVFRPCLGVSVVAGCISFALVNFIPGEGFINLVLIVAVCMAVSVPSILFIGMNVRMRERILHALKARLPH